MTEIDQAYARAQSGDLDGYTDWVRLVQIPLWSSLRKFAKSVDVEAVLQEGLLRMWVLAAKIGPGLAGENASLRYAQTVVRNLAVNEAAKWGKAVEFDPDRHGDDSIDPVLPPADPALQRLILGCLEKLTPKLGQALGARLASDGADSDATLAARLETKLNTFFQHIKRARESLRVCLESHGVRLKEYL